MERQVGEVFDYGYVKLKVVKADRKCTQCYFNDICEVGMDDFPCIPQKRKDQNFIIYKKVK